MIANTRPQGRRRTRLLAAGLTVVALGAAAAGCGDDDIDTAATTAASRTAASTTAASANDAQEADAEEHEGPVNPCDPGAPADALALEGAHASSDATIVEVTAVDHEFQGLDDSYPPGDYGFRMTNQGAEIHEMAVVRINDDETRSLDELIQLPEEEAQQVTEYLGGTVACPGQTAEALGIQLTPGRYVMLCFIPTGLTPDVPSTEEAFEVLGPPHFTQGMVTEIHVTQS